MMVTSVANAGWPDDILLSSDYAKAGLPNPSVIRPAKLASFMEDSAKALGRLSDAYIARVLATMREASGLTVQN